MQSGAEKKERKDRKGEKKRRWGQRKGGILELKTSGDGGEQKGERRIGGSRSAWGQCGPLSWTETQPQSPLC